jgi:hypothetical protein
MKANSSGGTKARPGHIYPKVSLAEFVMDVTGWKFEQRDESSRAQEKGKRKPQNPASHKNVA